MAIIEVTGTITRAGFFGGKGFEVTEFYASKDGEQRQRKYTAWFENAEDLNVGDEGTFTGQLSTKIDKWTNPDGSPKLDREGNPGQSIVVAINGTVFTPAGGVKTLPNAAALKDESPF